MTTICDYSDLPPTQCHHCHPDHRPGDVVRAARARQTMTIAHPVALQTTLMTDTMAAAILTKAVRALDRDQPATAHDYVQALTEPTTHHEPYTTQQTSPDGSSYWLTDRHRTISLPLIEQLQSAIATTGAIAGGAHAFSSKPAARVDAIDVLQDIETEAISWCRRLHLPVEDRRTGLQLELRVLIRSAAANAGGTMTRDLRSWWIRARTVTGWDAPSWRPDNTCPLCNVKGGLRVRLDAQTGLCLECGEGWDASTIGLLADHIRAENGEVVSDESGTMTA